MNTFLGSLRGRLARAPGARHWLLLAIGLSLVVAGPTTIRSQPEGPGPAAQADTPKASAWEQRWNVFGDPWSSKTVRNPFIPIGAGTTTYTILGPDAPAYPGDDELRYVGNANGIYVYDDGAKLLQPGKEFVLQVPGRPDVTYSSRRAREYFTRISQLNPDVRYIGYLTPNEIMGYYNGFDEILSSHPEWLMRDTDDGHPIQVVYTLDHGQRVLGEYLMDLGSPEYRQFIAQKAAESMRYHGFGGVLLDQFSDQFNTGHVYSGTIPESYRANWQANVRATVNAIKQAAPDKHVFLSPYDQDDAFMRSLLRAGADGYFFENPLGPMVASFDFLTGSGRLGLQYTLDKIALNRQEGRQVLISQSELGPGGTGSTSDTRAEAHRRYSYYLALYLVFLYSPASDVHYVYYTDNLRGAAYFRDSDVRIGAPTDDAHALANQRLWYREFEHGVVYVNLTQQPVRVEQPRPLYDAWRTPHTGNVAVPAQSGLILGEWDALPDPP